MVEKEVLGIIKKFLAPCTLVYKGMKIWPLLFNVIFHQGNALRPSLFELNLYPFKIEGIYLVPKVLDYCLYDDLIDFILLTTKMGFQFWGLIEVRRSHIRRIRDMRKDFNFTFSRSSNSYLWRLGRGVVLQEQITVSQLSSHLSCDFMA